MLGLGGALTVSQRRGPPLSPIDSADQPTTRKHLDGQQRHKLNGTRARRTSRSTESSEQATANTPRELDHETQTRAARHSPPTKDHTMSMLDSKPRVLHKLRSASGSALVALGALIAVSVLTLALTGANRTIPTSSATHPHPASTYSRPVLYRGTGACHAELNPMTGQLHGGCAIATSTANTPTP
jgi:hypothetical protein